MNLDAKITERQFRILELLSLGYAEKEIAEEMGVSVRTIDNTICRLKEKINVHKSTELSLFYLSKRFGFSFIISDKTKRAVSFSLALIMVLDSFAFSVPYHKQDFTLRRSRARTEYRISSRIRRSEYY